MYGTVTVSVVNFVGAGDGITCRNVAVKFALGIAYFAWD